MHTPAVLAVAVAFSLCACGGPPPSARDAQRLLARGDFAGAVRVADDGLADHPREPSLWRVKIRAAMASGDLDGAVTTYEAWRQLRGDDDLETLRMMALTTLSQGIRVPASEIRAAAIGLVERHAVESLAEDVAELVGSNDDLTAAAASIAILSAHPMAPRVAVDLLRSDDPRARALVVRGIARRVGELARGDLAPMLDDPDPTVRRAAVDALASFADPADADALLAATRDPDDQVRSRALRGLARTGDPRVLEAARQHLGDDYLGARIASVAALVKRGGESALPTLRELASGADLPVALRAAVALYDLTGEPVLGPVERAAASTDWTVRVAGLNSVADAAPSEVGLTHGGRAMVDERAEVRLAGARLLWQLGATDRATAELERALDAPRAEIRLQAAADLALRDHPRGVDTLSELAAAEALATRLAAVRSHAVAKLITPGLVGAFSDDSIEVRLAAADAVLATLD